MKNNLGWREHLQTLDHLRSVVGLRGYAQRDPLNEFKSEAFELFDSLMTRLRGDVTKKLSEDELPTDPNAQPEIPPEILAAMQGRAPQPAPAETAMAAAPAEAAPAPSPQDARAGAPLRAAVGIDPNDPETWGKVGRNDACPCGSGKKYKHCHGKI